MSEQGDEFWEEFRGVVMGVEKLGGGLRVRLNFG